MKDNNTNNTNNTATAKAYESKCKSHILTIATDGDNFAVLIDGKEWTDKVVSPRIGYNSDKTQAKRHYKSCYVNIDGKTISFSDISEDDQATLVKHYELVKGESFGVYNEYYDITPRAEGESKSKRAKKVKAKLFKTADELKAVDISAEDTAYLTADTIAFLTACEMRAEESQAKSLTLAKARRAVKDTKTAFKKAKQEYNRLSAEWLKVNAYTADEWQAQETRALAEQNAYTLALFPELSSVKELATKTKEQADTIAEQERELAELRAELAKLKAQKIAE